MKGVVEEKMTGYDGNGASFHSRILDIGVGVVNEKECLHFSKYGGKLSGLASESAAVARGGYRR